MPSLLRFSPVFLSSHWSSLSRPSIRMGSPFLTYLLTTSETFPMKSTSTNVTSSFFSPLSVENLRETASPIFAIEVPLGVTLTSGSRVTLPIRTTLLYDAMLFLFVSDSARSAS